MATDSKTFIAEQQQQLNANTQVVREILAGLSAAHINWRPDEKSWSLGQVVRHLILTEKSYAPNTEAAVKEAAAHTRQKKKVPPVKHTRTGKLAIWSLGPKIRFKMPAPKAFTPPSDVDENILEDFLLSQAELGALMQRASGLDLSHTKLVSPESKLIRLNLADVFRIHVVHEQRHVEQMKRVRKAPGFGRV
jgi:hypothetical protein